MKWYNFIGDDSKLPPFQLDGNELYGDEVIIEEGGAYYIGCVIFKDGELVIKRSDYGGASEIIKLNSKYAIGLHWAEIKAPF